METDNLVRTSTADGSNVDLRYKTVGRPLNNAPGSSDKDLGMSTPEDQFRTPPMSDKAQGEVWHLRLFGEVCFTLECQLADFANAE
jgi:hypothetical protein